MTERPNSMLRAGGFTAVVLFHVALIYLLATGLGKQAVQMLAAPIQTRIIQDVQPPPKAITVPQSPKPPPQQDFRTSTAPTPTASVAGPPVAAVRTGPSKIASAGCDIPEKPAISDRNGEKGTVTIAVAIGTDGRVTESSVSGSSGFKRLDDAGLAAISLCHFRPATVDGKPEASRSSVRYHFE